MTQFLSLHDAIATYVPDGSTIALEGFTHLIPFAAGHEIVRQGKRDLTLVRMTPDLIYDQLIGMGCAPRRGSCPRRARRPSRRGRSTGPTRPGRGSRSRCPPPGRPAPAPRRPG